MSSIFIGIFRLSQEQQEEQISVYLEHVANDEIRVFRDFESSPVQNLSGYPMAIEIGSNRGSPVNAEIGLEITIYCTQMQIENKLHCRTFGCQTVTQFTLFAFVSKLLHPQ